MNQENMTGKKTANRGLPRDEQGDQKIQHKDFMPAILCSMNKGKDVYNE